MKRSSWLVLLALGYAILRWVLLLHPGYVADMNAYKRWALRASQEGIAQVYATCDMDYPPLYAWILAPIGTAYGWIEPRASLIWPDPADSSAATASSAAEASSAAAASRVFNLLIKLPALLFDLGIGWLLFRLGKRADAVRSQTRPGADNRDGLPKRRRLPWSLVLPAVYLMNPVVLMDVAYWGAPDSIHSFFVLAAFLTLGFPGLLRIRLPGRRAAASAPAGDSTARQLGPLADAPDGSRNNARSAWPAWVLLTLATLMKPLGAPFFPLLLVLTVVWCGWRRVVTGGLAAMATVLIFFAPFLLAGQTATVFKRVVGDVSLMPFTSANAHNLWWALGAWKPADSPVLGPFSLTHFGLLAFGAAYVALLGAARRERAAARGRLAGAMGLLLSLGIVFCFFMLSTHMHENHLFLAIPLALALVPFDRPGERAFALLAGALTVGVFLNLVLHDPGISARFPFTLGGPTGTKNVDVGRPFYAGELAAIRFAVLWNLAVFAAFVWAVLRRGGLLARLAFTSGAGSPEVPPSGGHSVPRVRRGSC
jgi:hypothetical protein